MTTTTQSLLERLPVAEAMRPGVLTCPPETPLRAVARMMTTYRVHAIVVTAVDAEGESEEAVSVITSLDLTAVATGPDFAELSAREAATTELPTIDADERLLAAARLMGRRRLQHVLVVDPRTKQPVGFLSTLDVARALAAR